MILEVGKTYENRMGTKIKIISNRGPSSNYPFVGEDGEIYYPDGSYYSDEENPRDLIKEVKEQITIII